MKALGYAIATSIALMTVCSLVACKAKLGEGNGSKHAEPHSDAHANADEVTLTAEAVERYGITIDFLKKRVLRPVIVTSARVGFNTDAMAHVGSPLRGRVIELKVRLGQDVKKGDELCVIESPELGEAQADLLQKHVARDSAGPAVALAKSSWDRAKGLFEQNQSTSLAEVQRREVEYKAAVATQRAADAAAVAAENRLHLLGMNQPAVDDLLKTGEIAPHYAILAMIDGQVVQREITLGELVGPERDALMVLANLSSVWVLADVPEARLSEIAVGAKAWVNVGASRATPIEGQVAYISPSVDMTTRTAQVRIEVVTKEASLKPGMFARVEIVAGNGGVEPAPVLAVPDGAVQTVEGGPAVFVPVEDEPNTFARRAVSIGRSVGGFVPVYAGLAEDELFVAAGSFILKAELGKGSAAHEH